MCDTFVALSNATRDGSVIFGKNSDRDPNEAHQLLWVPEASHPAGSQVICTYIKIPQVEKTHAVLLSKPFWIWGAEMGVNDQGVVIGNEALFTKVPYQKEPGLIGMDFLRLALERAATADDALDVIIELLERYGQGGNCGFAHRMYYHNGFLIADRSGAWVLETAGKHWAAEKVRDVRSISNRISIGAAWDRASSDLVSHAVSQGWCQNEDAFDFGKCYSDVIYTTFSASRSRYCRTSNLLEAERGKIDLPFAMALLRDHGEDAGRNWQPGSGLTGAEVCMHASFGPIRINQTTGSMVSHLTPTGDTHWLTGTAAPCTSIFKPVWIAGGLPDLGPPPVGTYDEQSLWWRHESLHREILRDYATRQPVIASACQVLEADFLNKAEKDGQASGEERAGLTEDCFRRAEEAEAAALEDVRSLPVKNRRPLLDKIAWRKLDREAERFG